MKAVPVKDCEEINLDVAQLAYIYGARPVLSIDQDLELVKKGVKTRKPVMYGNRVIIRR